MSSPVTPLPGFRPGQRKAVRLSGDAPVESGYLEGLEGLEGRRLPLLLQPGAGGVDPVAWAAARRDFLAEQLDRHGGILLRGFGLSTERDFESFVAAACGSPLAYSERSSPRTQVSGHIYTSTDHPAEQSIFLHNEQSYNLSFPQKIVFFCMRPAERGGETPIADTRRVFARLPEEVRDRFLDQGYMYVRNFGCGMGLSWQEAFQTEDPAEVEQYCRANGIEWEWGRDDRSLRTRQVRRAAALHPRTGEPAWVNHITFFHVSTLEPRLREVLLAELGVEGLPNNTYYGDGTPIEPEVTELLRAAYRTETVAFPWQQGDVLLLDNMTVAHGRNPFSGPRKVVVGMADLARWDDLAEVPRARAAAAARDLED